MRYKFCPICGGELEIVDNYDEGKVPYCKRDDQLFFDVPKPCIMVAVIKNDNILLLKQSYIYKDSLVLIAGYIGIDEKAEETVKREILEETGITVSNVKFLGTEYVPGKELLMLTYYAQYESGEIIKSDEVEMARWHKLNESLELMKEDNIGKKIVKKILRNNSSFGLEEEK